MAILIPEITNAESIPKIEILTIEKKIKESDEYSKKLCNAWDLNKENIKDFFLTAEPFITGAEMSYFDIYPCETKGYLLINDVKRKYSINLGGSGFIYGFGKEQEGFGCRKGKCLEYVHYEEYEED
ncbi:hypothetical protein [Entomomonas asaccharolytica]|uniref:Uncharacterized protein n=1 Tax=Entomomonas asaccharolytica TaxID=2785331 RepID=A0A974NG66_9GAMM|nr:hypothetical protein [Entomomonas asaccharolytica]QQP86056.1 hypothetical protein JHT90_02025 [Entomomonas asaccharolytica]